jgi:Alpha amylase, catalytic domain/Bacterial Alpha amylase C-terminal domain
MAENTPSGYRNLVVYEIFVRNHGPNGTFADVAADLQRIRALHVDVIWLMPIHPIGQHNRKGRMGSPYSVRDYSAINPEYGTRADFSSLLDQAHQLGLKVLLDVVFNHTSCDSILLDQHPDWYLRDAEGRLLSTKEMNWTDVIEVKRPNGELANYFIQVLQEWAAMGVDGFRCDVASFLPVEFWLEARRALARVKPGIIWLGESAPASFIAARREAGLPVVSDNELYRAFDLTYDHDLLPIWRAAVRGHVPVTRYLEMLRFQDSIYPANFVKLRFVENHDQPRIMRLARGRSHALAWTAFQAFNKGAFLIHAGQESAAVHTPSLFDIDKVEWGDYELQSFIGTLAGLKQEPALREGTFTVLEDKPAIQAVWRHAAGSLYGIFNVSQASGQVRTSVPDGECADLLSGATVQVRDGMISLPDSTVILRVEAQADWKPFYSDLLDYQDEPNEDSGAPE